MRVPYLGTDNKGVLNHEPASLTRKVRDATSGVICLCNHNMRKMFCKTVGMYIERSAIGRAVGTVQQLEARACHAKVSSEFWFKCQKHARTLIIYDGDGLSRNKREFGTCADTPAISRLLP